MQCFQKDPNLRVSARKLLKHPWVVTAKRSESIMRVPTNHDEAVKSVQQWNEALKSPNAGSARKPFKPSTSPSQRRSTNSDFSTTPVKGSLGLSRPRTQTEAFMSPEAAGMSSMMGNHQAALAYQTSDDDDNWDDDFASAISPSVLQLSRRSGPLPHLASAERLKSFASNDGSNESWDDHFEGDLQTVRNTQPVALRKETPMKQVRHSKLTMTVPSSPEDDSMETIRPWVPRRQSEPVIPDPPLMVPVQKKTLPVRSVSPKKKAPTGKPRKFVIPSRNLTRTPSSFREDTLEDYSDLAPVSEASFAKKVDLMKKDASLSPRLFHPSDLKSLPRSASSSQNGGSLRNRLPNIVDGESSAHKMRRSRSSLEIQRFAEADGEEDYSDIFGGSEAATDDARSEISADESASLMLNSKLSNNSWLGDEEGDEEDPFAELEEGFDEMGRCPDVVRGFWARLMRCRLGGEYCEGQVRAVVCAG